MSKYYVVETTAGLEYTFDFEEVFDFVIHESGALVVEGTDAQKAHAFAPGAWVRWYILADAEPEPAAEPDAAPAEGAS